MRDLKLALRTLFKTPFVTAVAILSLALGIGANAAIFSLFEQTLLRPLSVTEPGRLVNLSSPGPKRGAQSCGQAGECDEVFSYPMFRDLERSQSVLSSLAAHVQFGVNLSFRQQPMEGQGILVSGSYFPTLGIRPVLGRLLGPSDDQNIGGHFVAVLGYKFWAARFGADPGVINETITVNGRTLTVVGVAPRDFHGTTLGLEPMVYVPLTMRALMVPGWTEFEGLTQFQNRRDYWLYLFGRLKPGVSLAQARTALNALYRPLINEVEAPLQKGMSEQTLASFKAKEIGLADGRRGQSTIRREVRAPLLMLFGIAGIALLIACANIANLLLARGANRAMEMAVRLALGASRRQLVAQLLTESMLLAVMGGIASLLVAWWTLGAIGSLLPPETATTFHLELQPSMLAFAATLSIGTGFLFGLSPALHSTRPDLISAICASAGQISGTRAATRFRATLVTVQIALSMTLLIAAGLFLKSLVNVSRVDLGVRVNDVVTFRILPKLSGYDSTRSAILFERVEEELAATPGVTGVTASLVPLLDGSNWAISVRVQGFAPGPDVDKSAQYNEVGAGHFSTLGMRMLAGREFTRADSKGSPQVAVVNEAFARKFNLGQDAIGKFMSKGGRDSLTIQIVGLVQNARYSDVKTSVAPTVFTPWRQDGGLGWLNLYVRTSLPPELLLRTIPAVLKRIDPMLPVSNLKTMPQQVRENVFLDRMISILSAAFAVLATLLAAVGLYGVLAYTVAQRTREIGVRMALGADAGRVQWMVLRQVGVMLGIGGALGVAAAFVVGRAAGSMLFELKGYDPMVFALSVAVLSLIALGAGYLPARRAARIDPMHALRYD